MVKWFFAAILIALLFGFQFVKKERVILVILAHPDDEMAVAQALVKYTANSKVYLIIATDGRNGTKPGFPTGDSLVRLREQETRCACEILGLQPPIFLGFADEFGKQDVPVYFKKLSELKKTLITKIEEINPDIIITFGPDGDTGHQDHRFIGALVTDIILNQRWVEKIALYYVAWTDKDVEKFKDILPLNTIHPGYINVSVKYSNEEEDIAMRSAACYKSQISDDELKMWIEVEKKDTRNTLFFRRFAVARGKSSTF